MLRTNTEEELDMRRRLTGNFTEASAINAINANGREVDADGSEWNSYYLAIYTVRQVAFRFLLVLSLYVDVHVWSL